jgi:tripartite-type tricarboxylate transporter receptor subunit TctC
MLANRAFLFAVAGVILNLAASAAADEIYPNRTIKLVVPFPPGGASEFAIRAIADRLSARFGQAVVIENRPGGAGGTVGAVAVAAAPPDGYTLLATPPGPLVTAAAMYKNLGYDPARSFAPVALLFNSPQLLIVHPQVPASSIAELVDHARRNPGRISFASPGHGTQPHLLGEMLKSTAKLDIVHVPYKGPAAAVTDALAGQVQMYFETAPMVLPHVEAGKLRLLAIAAETRMPQSPDVPTTVEGGYPTLIGGYWAGIVAPAGTPATIVDQLNAAINETMKSQQVEAALTKLGGQAKLGSPADFASFIAAERQRWWPVATAVKAD